MSISECVYYRTRAQLDVTAGPSARNSLTDPVRNPNAIASRFEALAKNVSMFSQYWRNERINGFPLMMRYIQINHFDISMLTPLFITRMYMYCLVNTVNNLLTVSHVALMF